jgi:hypothetical protein
MHNNNETYTQFSDVLLPSQQQAVLAEYSLEHPSYYQELVPMPPFHSQKFEFAS